MVKDNSIKNYHNQYKNNAIFFENIFKKNINKRVNEVCSEIYYTLTGVRLAKKEEFQNNIFNQPPVPQQQNSNSNLNNDDPFGLFNNEVNNNQNNNNINNNLEENIPSEEEKLLDYNFIYI